jgi:hypothetical protein
MAQRADSTMAAPHRIVFSGGPLRDVVVMEDWNENLRLMQSLGRVRTIPPGSLGTRPRIDVAMYWGPFARAARVPGDSGVQIQRGEYYPKFRNQDALWVFGPIGRTPSSTREIDPAGIEILVGYGLPRASR